jgi:hypothetical protein
MTGRSLSQRLTEHKRDVRYGVETNALFCHLRDQHHRINWDSSKIIHPSTNFFTRRVVESALISSTTNFNLKPGDAQVDPAFTHLINKALHKAHPPD